MSVYEGLVSMQNECQFIFKMSIINGIRCGWNWY